ncbi:LIC11213 family lipoprotein [Leptospira bourretii]|uniref:LIC11213 family lipoprotein n=1 Tax=Leptospira bourretii TaxID=2484962 RepID=UPI003CCFE9F7
MHILKSSGFVLLLVLSVFLNCRNEKSSDKEGVLESYALLLGSSTPLAEITDADCTDPAPTFATLSQAGTTTTCANCHNAGNANAGFDITSYNSTKNRITVGNPRGSLLFNKINTGSMRIYNTNSINKAVYCWTLKGANP